ncbi:MAG: vWA domain-containing protein, partial [Bacteroidota bacterium]
MPSIHLEFTSGVLILLATAAAAAGLAVLFYRTTVPPVGRGRRALMAGLRGTGLALLALLLFEPLLRLVTSSSNPPVLAVLVDASRSMRIRDGAGSRSDTLRRILEGPALKEAAAGGEVAYFGFGTSLRPLPDPPADSLRLEAAGTDIAGALEDLREAARSRNIRAAVLITDGAWTMGTHPLHAAERLGLPLFTVGVGDSAVRRDILVSRAAVNSLVYAGTEVPVDVTIRSSGYEGRTVEAVLTVEGREEARTTLVLAGGEREQPLRLGWTARGEGMQKMTVRVSSLEGELTSRNNRHVLYARVLRSRLRVLLLSGGPGYDAAVLGQTLREDGTFQVRSLVQRRDGGFYGEPWSGPALDSADCLLLAGFPSAATPEAVTAALLARIDRDGVPLL